jgi:hypothetical protein
MFKKSDIHTQLDLFSSPTEYFRDSKRKKFLKEDSWHNQFRKQVVMRVDESIFSVLYTEYAFCRHDDPQRGPRLERRTVVRELSVQSFGTQRFRIDVAGRRRTGTLHLLSVSWWNMPGSTVKTCSKNNLKKRGFQSGLIYGMIVAFIFICS